MSKGEKVLNSTKNLITSSGHYSACSASDAVENTPDCRGLLGLTQWLMERSSTFLHADRRGLWSSNMHRQEEVCGLVSAKEVL